MRKQHHAIRGLRKDQNGPAEPCMLMRRLCQAAFIRMHGIRTKETTYDVPQDVSKSGICSKSGCREE